MSDMFASQAAKSNGSKKGGRIKSLSFEQRLKAYKALEEEVTKDQSAIKSMSNLDIASLLSNKVGYEISMGAVASMKKALGLKTKAQKDPAFSNDALRSLIRCMHGLLTDLGRPIPKKIQEIYDYVVRSGG